MKVCVIAGMLTGAAVCGVFVGLLPGYITLGDSAEEIRMGRQICLALSGSIFPFFAGAMIASAAGYNRTFWQGLGHYVTATISVALPFIGTGFFILK